MHFTSKKRAQEAYFYHEHERPSHPHNVNWLISGHLIVCDCHMNCMIFLHIFVNAEYEIIYFKFNKYVYSISQIGHRVM